MYHSQGTIYYDMPRIPPKATNCVVFFYQTQEDADAGLHPVGTGFLISMPTAHPARSFIYLVTNRHVAVRNRSEIFYRLEKRDVGQETRYTESSQWHHLQKYDIAVIGVPGLNTEEHAVGFVPVEGLLTEYQRDREKIGIGDDVFMIGMFSPHQTGGRRPPAARFGHISANPAPIRQGNGVVADSYSVDMNSRPGFSGSPVFVYRTPGYDLEEQPKPLGPETKILTGGVNFFGLLGIHWGQFPYLWQVSESGELVREDASADPDSLIAGERFIKGLSGMTCVLPAWAIIEVLNMDALRVQRERANARLAEEAALLPVPE